MLTISLSAYQSWQRCEQKYFYQYVRRLRPVVKDIAPQRGVILHDYLAAYYRALMDGQPALKAHNTALQRIDAYVPQLKAASSTMFMVGREDDAEDFTALPDILHSIAGRYYAIHGMEDAEKYRIVLVEEKVRVQLLRNVQSMSVIDLVMEHRDPPRTMVLSEHKSVKTVPEMGTRIRDFQTLLYANVLQYDPYKIAIDEVLWNYLRTKEPSEPHILKDGGLSKAKNMDTTWDVYMAAIEREHLDPADYLDVRERLLDRERTAFFPRYTTWVVADVDMLLKDYVTTAQRILAARKQWELGVTKPVRSLSRECDWCPFYKICEASIMGGDEEDVVRMSFTTEREEQPA